MKKTTNFILGAFTGALVGSAVAILYAPEKGSTTRDRISYRLNTYANDLSELIDRLSREKEKVSEAKRKGELVVEDAKKRAEDLLTEAEDLLDTIDDAKSEERDSSDHTS
jgi:gas vesicle protein